MSVAPAAPLLVPVPGTEPNLYLLECQRCGEPMNHHCQVEGDFPLCIWWALTCGECGRVVNAWEDKVNVMRYQTTHEFEADTETCDLQQSQT